MVIFEDHTYILVKQNSLPYLCVTTGSKSSSEWLNITLKHDIILSVCGFIELKGICAGFLLFVYTCIFMVTQYRVYVVYCQKCAIEYKSVGGYTISCMCGILSEMSNRIQISWWLHNIVYV